MTALHAPYTTMHSALFPPTSRRQQGVTLIELLVGIAIGLLVVAVAMGALMASRGISGTVSEATSLQQEAAYAFRVMGQQIRQAGSIKLDLNPEITNAAATGSIDFTMIPVAFDAPDTTDQRESFDRATQTLTGDNTPSFTVGYQNYTEKTTTSEAAYLLRDCLGENASTRVLTNKFQRNAKNELVCTGAGNSSAQPIIGNVTDMRVRYVQQETITNNLKYHTTPPGNWPSIYAVEVCLELTGTEVIPTNDAKYINCNGDETSYGDHLKMVFRNLYQIRSQGQKT